MPSKKEKMMAMLGKAMEKPKIGKAEKMIEKRENKDKKGKC